MNWPIHPHLIVLRSLATLVISAVIGQAGWAAAGLGRDESYFRLHAAGAVLTVAICVITAGGFLLLRRTAGPLLLTLAVLMAALSVVQFILGEAEIVDVHIFVGVLTAMIATALTSWTYRHPPPTSAPRTQA